MVGFGDTLRKSRRQGWEDAYLNYDGLKSIRNQLEQVLIERDKHIAAHLSFEQHDSGSTAFDLSSLQEGIRRCSSKFVSKLHSEIEKVTLFSLARLGDLADSLGALRFDKKSASCGTTATGNEIVTIDGTAAGSTDVSTTEKKPGGSAGFNFDDFGEHGSLLPASDQRSYSDMSASRRPSRYSSISTSLFPREKIFTMIGHDCNLDEDRAQIYSELGVELLHLQKFACLNAMGVRKIVKKYEKTFLEYPLGNDFEHTKGATLLSNRSDDRLLQLISSQPFATIYASLLDALVHCETILLQSAGICKSLSEPLISSDTHFLLKQLDMSQSVLRFECTVSSIHAIQQFTEDASKPFEVFISRRAMIGEGKDRTDSGSSDTRVIDLLVRFEPDFILDMTESELHEWYQRAIAKPELHRKHLSIDNPFLARTNRSWGGVGNASMVINLISVLLYTTNYYIIAPTANHYAIQLGTDGEFGASLIGASSFAAIFSAFFYSMWYAYSPKIITKVLVISAICPLVGNLMYSFAITYKSMKLALVGRLLCGFGSAEIVNRQLISDCVSVTLMTRASALFVSASAISMSIGPLLAAIIDMTAGRSTDIDIQIHLPWSPRDSGVIINHTTAPGFLMSILWALHLIGLLAFFYEPVKINVAQPDSVEVETKHERPSISHHLHKFANSTASIFRAIFQSASFPVTLFLFALIELAGEVLISSCSMIVRRYFRWTGSKAGLIVASLGALVLPAHYIVERASRSFSERRIMKLSIISVVIGSILICNFEGLALDFIGHVTGIRVDSNNKLDEDRLDQVTAKDKHVIAIREIVKKSSKHGEFPYDWGAGAYVYILALSVIFIALIILEGVNTSIMCKSTPAQLNNTFMNMGLLATLVGTFGRVFGDVMIIFTAFIGRSPLHDFVSAIFLPLSFMMMIGWYLVTRYYRQLLV